MNSIWAVGVDAIGSAARKGVGPRENHFAFSDSLLWFLLIGLIAGWLAGQIMKGRGFGLLGNLIVGMLGALLGGFFFRLLGLPTYGLLGSLVTAVVGAIVLLFLIGLIEEQHRA